jgi:hypothetical protein
MLETIAKRRLEAATLGLTLRLGIGAVFSIGDMASDAVQIVALFLAGQSLRAVALLAMIVMNLAAQALFVILQNARLGWRVVLWELSFVFSLLKPAIDAVRVARGDERVDGAPFDPLVEMVLCKCSEMTFESIPGGLAQAIFLLDGGDWTTSAVVSVCLSCISTAFTVTTMDFDLDTNKGRRSKNPEFYGYIPDTSAGHFIIFTLLFLYHSAHTLGNTFSMALLAQTSWVWLVAYLLADHCGLILYKLTRGDLFYWIPGLGVLLSMLERFGTKVIVDFTGCAHAQSLAQSALSPVVAYACGQTTRVLLCCKVCSPSPPTGAGRHLLLRQRTEERRLVVRRRRSLLAVLRRRDDRAWSRRRYQRFCGQLLRLPQHHGRQLHRSRHHRCRGHPRLFEGIACKQRFCTTATGAVMHASKIGDLPLFATVGALAAVWLIAVVGLSRTIKREYLHTFVSLQTGYADSQSYFLDNQGNDARRVLIFFSNERHWQAIRDRVRQWVLSAYAAWQALMPAFFTADLQARIPDDFMPGQVVEDLSSVAAELDRGVPLPMPLPIPPTVGTFTTNPASILAGSDPMDSEPLAPAPPAGP